MASPRARCVALGSHRGPLSHTRAQYTIGLGQEYMAFVDDREDIHSFMLTGAHSSHDLLGPF
jgi:3-hydroxy-3-methylglutaryl CoA synthase